MVLGDKIVEAGDKMRAVKRDSPTKVDNLTYTTAVADQDQGNRSFSEVAHQIYCITPPPRTFSTLLGVLLGADIYN